MFKNSQAQSFSSQLGRRVSWGTHQAETGSECQFCILNVYMVVKEKKIENYISHV
jgi:hypothetical protein